MEVSSPVSPGSWQRAQGQAAAMPGKWRARSLQRRWSIDLIDEVCVFRYLFILIGPVRTHLRQRARVGASRLVYAMETGSPARSSLRARTRSRKPSAAGWMLCVLSCM